MGNTKILQAKFVNMDDSVSVCFTYTQLIFPQKEDFKTLPLN